MDDVRGKGSMIVEQGTHTGQMIFKIDSKFLVAALCVGLEATASPDADHDPEDPVAEQQIELTAI